MQTEIPGCQATLLVFKPSPIHGTGAFAAEPIAAGARIIEYVGEKITKSESVRRCEQGNNFIFALHEDVDIDGNVPWNPARLINHSCAPNAEAHPIDGRIWIVASQEIQAGAEVTFNYGFDLEHYRDYPCHCGGAECVGFIVAEEFFHHVRARRI